MAPLFLTPSHTRTLTNPQAENIVRGCHEGKSLKRGCCTVAAYPLTAETAREVKNEMIFWGVAWAWSALAGRKAIPRFLARFRDFERPEHAPRNPAGTHTCTLYRRAPCVPRSREREQTRGRWRTACKCAKKALQYIKQ